MDTMLLLILTAILVEGVVEWVKEVKKEKPRWPKILALALSFVILFLMDLDFFALLEKETSIPFLGSFLLAFVVSRGANYVHDFLGHITAWRQAS